VLKSACEGLLVLQDEKEGLAKDLLEIVRPEVSKNKKRAGRLWGSGSVPKISDEERANIPNSWVWAKVKDLGFDPDETVQVGPMSMQSKDFEDDGLPVLNVGCVQWGYFVESKLNYLPSHKAAEFGRYKIQSGDVLFTRSGTVGRCAVARERQNGWLMTFHLLRVRPNPEKCIPDYLQIVFEGANHIRKQTRDASIGTTRAGFNTNLLAMLDIPLAPLDEQQRIVAEVERRLSVVRQVESVVEAGLVRAGRLRRAVLRSAFEGRL
jgi:type I restriction enzyme S subunit